MKMYLNENEKSLSARFQEKGYVISTIKDNKLFERIVQIIINYTKESVGGCWKNNGLNLNEIHKLVEIENLNELRLNIINKINSNNLFRKWYFESAREELEILVGNELAMQLRINLSIQLPDDDSSLLPIHADVWSGDSPYEVVVWIPLVNCYGTKSMYILPPKEDIQLRKKFETFKGKSSEELYRYVEDKVDWVDIGAGQILIFNQNLPHGNRINKENETRWSLNCRFKGIFTPYGEKKIGEFFEPITLKAASRIGMRYQFPKLLNNI
jgi:sporadic carbohydrate cluster 2OG-Fe(II) oxygenase